ncbi:hypothetical protein [Nesterenkonia sp. NBAIMH1]|uniref:hypothetical protein n=1 Tax=Nesterenkonia sp. NBAIMH1 TaxID=2600320 RepID=UPI0011B858B2|nr:hypothetical protein [Nesterenkonia sp. NBAIMH1]
MVESAAALAVSAVRAIPELRWGAVDVHVSADEVSVAEISVPSVISGGHEVLTGSAASIVDQIVQPALADMCIMVGN